jgi:histidine triad (HIT) family protein
MIYDPKNVFAKILRKEISVSVIDENEVALCFKDIHPRAPIHYLVIPKNPYVDMFDFYTNASMNEIRGFWQLVKRVIPVNGKVESNYGSYLEVHHFHLHVMGEK